MAQRDTTPGQNSASSKNEQTCPDCESGFEFLTLRDFFSRRDFMKAAGATALAAGTMGLPNVLARVPELPKQRPAPARRRQLPKRWSNSFTNH